MHLMDIETILACSIQKTSKSTKIGGLPAQVHTVKEMLSSIWAGWKKHQHAACLEGTRPFLLTQTWWDLFGHWSLRAMEYQWLNIHFYTHGFTQGPLPFKVAQPLARMRVNKVTIFGQSAYLWCTPKHRGTHIDWLHVKALFYILCILAESKL